VIFGLSADRPLVCIKDGLPVGIPINNKIVQGDKDGKVNGLALSGCFFKSAIKDVTFKGFIGDDGTSVKLNLKGVKFRVLTKLNDVKFIHCDMEGAQFATCRLDKVLFNWTILSKANFFKTYITGGQDILKQKNVSFYGVTANSGVFTSAKFENTRMLLVNFSLADFLRSGWSSVWVGNDSNLRGASFIESSLEDVNMEGLDASYTNFSGAKIKGLNFEGSAWSPLNLVNAKFDDFQTNTNITVKCVTFGEKCLSSKKDKINKISCTTSQDCKKYEL